VSATPPVFLIEVVKTDEAYRATLRFRVGDYVDKLYEQMRDSFLKTLLDVPEEYASMICRTDGPHFEAVLVLNRTLMDETDPAKLEALSKMRLATSQALRAGALILEASDFIKRARDIVEPVRAARGKGLH